MTNVLGDSYAYTSFAPVLPGRADELRELLRGLPTGLDSPLAKVERIHFARWMVFDSVRYQGPPQKHQDVLQNEYLLFAADFDGTELEPLADDLLTHMRAETDAIWGHCVAYPGVDDAAAFREYLRRTQIETGLTVGWYADSSVREVREALELRRKLLDFAIRAQDLDARERHALYRSEFALPGA